MLRAEDVTTVVVAGVSLNVAVPNLVFELGHRAYHVVVVRDAVAGYPVEYGEQVLKHTLRMVATLATTDEVLAVWGATA
jgi:nicotinamidase-related amidase